MTRVDLRCWLWMSLLCGGLWLHLPMMQQPAFAGNKVSSLRKKLAEVERKIKGLDQMLNMPSVASLPSVKMDLITRRARLRAQRRALRKTLRALAPSARRARVARRRVRVVRRRPPKRRRPESSASLRMRWTMPGMPGAASGSAGRSPGGADKDHDQMNKQGFDAERQRLLRAKKEEAARERQRQALQRLIGKARQAFASGRVKRSRRLYKKAGKFRKLRTLDKFLRDLRTGRRFHHTRSTEEAIPLLLAAHEAALELGGRRGVFVRRAGQMLTNMYVSKALLALSQRQYKAACNFLRSARRYTPKDSKTARLFKKLRRVAKRYLSMAKKFEKSDRSLFRAYLLKALMVLDRSDPLSLRVRRMLAQ